MKLEDFLNFYDFSYNVTGNGLQFIDLQGANLGGICDDDNYTPKGMVERLQGSIYEKDYIDVYFEEEVGVDVANMSYQEMIQLAKENNMYDEMIQVLKVLDNPELIEFDDKANGLFI